MIKLIKTKIIGDNIKINLIQDMEFYSGYMVESHNWCSGRMGKDDAFELFDSIDLENFNCQNEY